MVRFKLSHRGVYRFLPVLTFYAGQRRRYCCSCSCADCTVHRVLQRIFVFGERDRICAVAVAVNCPVEEENASLTIGRSS